MFYGHDGRHRGGGISNYHLGNYLDCMSIFEAERENVFWEKSCFLMVTYLTHLKVNISQASPLLVKCQAYNTTLKFQQRVIIFSFFFSPNNINLELASVQIFSRIHFKK